MILYVLYKIYHVNMVNVMMKQLKNSIKHAFVSEVFSLNIK
jgi:hypothetical protein